MHGVVRGWFICCFHGIVRADFLCIEDVDYPVQWVSQGSATTGRAERSRLKASYLFSLITQLFVIPRQPNFTVQFFDVSFPTVTYPNLFLSASLPFRQCIRLAMFLKLGFAFFVSTLEPSSIN